MTNFGPNPPVGASKVGMIRTIAKIRTATESGELNWRIVFHNFNYKVFSTSINYTPLKKLIISLRTSTTSTDKNDNVLKMMFKIESANEYSYRSKSSILMTIYLNEVPSLVSLCKILNKKYLGVEYTPPLNIFSTLKNKESTVVEINDVETYRDEVLMAMRAKMRELDRELDDWDGAFEKIYAIYTKAEKSTEYNELNDYLYELSETIKQFNIKGRGRQ